MMSPCKDCDERFPNCHSKGDKYKDLEALLIKGMNILGRVRRNKVIFLGGVSNG